MSAFLTGLVLVIGALAACWFNRELERRDSERRRFRFYQGSLL